MTTPVRQPAVPSGGTRTTFLTNPRLVLVVCLRTSLRWGVDCQGCNVCEDIQCGGSVGKLFFVYDIIVVVQLSVSDGVCGRRQKLLM